MSTLEHVYLFATAGLPALAEELAAAAGLTVGLGSRDEVYLSRPSRLGTGEAGGELYVHDFADPDAGVEDESLLDSFPFVLDVGYTGRDRETQFAEARILFSDLSGRLSLSMALVRGFDFLVACRSPATGPVWLPDGTTPYAPDRAAWLPFRPGR